MRQYSFVGALVTLLCCVNLRGVLAGISTHNSLRSSRDGANAETYSVPALGFPYEALEGAFVGSQTMHLHHDKHHATYVMMLNKALASAGMHDPPKDVAKLVARLDQIPVAQRTLIRNHGGGHMNHGLFWRWLTPGGPPEPRAEGHLHKAISDNFGSFEAFQSAFEAAAASQFGSGWCWLVRDPRDGGLRVCSTANQDNPVMDIDIGDCHGTPILGLDVWEHAYYLDHFNVRPQYIKAFWKVVNWDEAEKLLLAAEKEPLPHSAAGRMPLMPVAVAAVLAILLGFVA